MIWDTFMFRNEWECLEVRLHELGDYVDMFVLCEADWTFQGGRKRAEFAADPNRFPEFAGRLRHVLAPEPASSDPWEREAAQRNAIMLGLRGVQNADTVLLSDCDEIPRGEAVEQADRMLRSGVFQVAFDQTLSFYHVNNRCYTTSWQGTQALRANNFAWRTPEGVRQMRGSLPAIPNGGVHWCNLGGPEWLIEKIESFAHHEVNLPEYKDPELLARCIAEGREMTGRSDILFRREEPEAAWLPAYLLENRERFAHLFAEVPAAA